MRNLNRSFFSFFLAAALLLGLASCRDAGPKPQVKGDTHVKAAAPTKAASPFPAEPIDFPIKALEGNESIPLNVEVRGQDGKEIKLSKLVSGPTLLVYIDDDTDSRQNRAATRMVRRLVREGRGVGFRTAFVQRTLEHGAARAADAPTDPDADVSVADFNLLAEQLGA